MPFCDGLHIYIDMSALQFSWYSRWSKRIPGLARNLKTCHNSVSNHHPIQRTMLVLWFLVKILTLKALILIVKRDQWPLRNCWCSYEMHLTFLPEDIICVILQYILCLHVHNAVSAITFCKQDFMIEIYDQSFTWNTINCWRK